MLRHGSRWAGSAAALLTAGLFACGAENETETENQSYPAMTTVADY